MKGSGLVEAGKDVYLPHRLCAHGGGPGAAWTKGRGRRHCASLYLQALIASSMVCTAWHTAHYVFVALHDYNGLNQHAVALCTTQTKSVWACHAQAGQLGNVLPVPCTGY